MRTISLPLNAFRNLLDNVYHLEDKIESVIEDNPKILRALQTSRRDYEMGRVGILDDLRAVLKPLK